MIGSVHHGTKIAPVSPGRRKLGSPNLISRPGMDQGSNGGLGCATVSLGLSVGHVHHGLPGCQHFGLSSVGRWVSGGGRQATTLVLCQIADQAWYAYVCIASARWLRGRFWVLLEPGTLTRPGREVDILSVCDEDDQIPNPPGRAPEMMP